jgi:radical SAM superfamily enzyme YgiQ (UPF0313 family)
MVDLLLTHGYFLSEDAAERRVMKPYPPLGLLYLSAYLKARGFDVEVFDTTFSTRGEFRRFLEVRRPPVVGIYANLMTKLNVLAMIAECRSFRSRVIVGGPDVPEYAAEYLAHGADVAVLGEGERTMEELLPALERGSPLRDVAGIVYRDDGGEPVRTAPRPLIEDLDLLPLPDREAINLHAYIDTWRAHHGMGSVSLICARGCPYTCTWCSRSVYGESHRRRSVQSVVDEIVQIRERYRPDMLWFADDVFTINHRWFNEFYDVMQARGIRIPFECITRADRLTDDILEKMSRLGAARIWYGSESGSQRILDAMQRRVTVEEIRTVTQQARRHGIQTGLFVMLGYPGEELSDIEETVDHLKSAGADTFLTTVAYPIKGTEFHTAVRTKIRGGSSWESGSDRQLSFAGRYSHRFYWFANRYVVNAVRSHQHRVGGRFWRQVSSGAKAKAARLGMELTRWEKS